MEYTDICLRGNVCGTDNRKREVGVMDMSEYEKQFKGSDKPIHRYRRDSCNKTLNVPAVMENCSTAS
jgi:hypothetical protein